MMCKRAKNFRPRPQILSPPVYIDFLHSYAEIIFKYGCQQSCAIPPPSQLYKPRIVTYQATFYPKFENEKSDQENYGILDMLCAETLRLEDKLRLQW
ncbi:hypothetical protein P8452_55232 [Trifolium repens]|nr:hypothetical protein P8452_55232 [Trifolium repens]